MILASQSPRRAEILSMLGYRFEILAAECDESTGTLSAEEAVRVLAERKALAVAALRRGEIVIGSDTLVTLDSTPIGKPKDADDAKRMLRLLSGRTHTVYTGVAIVNGSEVESFVSKAEVEFYPLSDDDIERYVASKEPLDKAGSYGIQGKGAVLVKGISGDYLTIVGLPAAELAQRLKKYKIYPES